MFPFGDNFINDSINIEKVVDSKLKMFILNKDSNLNFNEFILECADTKEVIKDQIWSEKTINLMAANFSEEKSEMFFHSLIDSKYLTFEMMIVNDDITEKFNKFFMLEDKSSHDNFSFDITTEIKSINSNIGFSDVQNYIKNMTNLINYIITILTELDIDINIEHILELIDSIKGLFRMAWEPRGEHSSVAETLQGYLMEFRSNSSKSAGWRTPNFLVMGNRGRKALQGDTYAPLSSNCDWFLRSLQIPCVIAKRGRGSSKTTPRHWIMAVDGTVYTNRALDMLFTLIKPRDTLELFYVRPGGHESNRDMQYIDYLKAYYEKELAEQGPYNAAFNMIKKEDKESLSDCIVRYVNEKDPHYLTMGPRATAFQHLSPLMVHVVNNVNCNLMIGMN